MLGGILQLIGIENLRYKENNLKEKLSDYVISYIPKNFIIELL